MLNDHSDAPSNLSSIDKLRRWADGPPRQDVFFDSQDQPPEKWAWVVLYRLKDFGPKLDAEGEWSEWATANPRPNHFRSRWGAETRIAGLILEHERKIRLGLVEFKVEPKYIGYVPGKDESWIKD